MSFKIVEGDLFKYIHQNKIDVVAQGVNCFNTQKSGIAPLFVKHFRTDEFEWEQERLKGYYNKLGTINWMKVLCDNTLLNTKFLKEVPEETEQLNCKQFFVVNCYTQFEPGANAEYVWLVSCLKKLNFDFKGLSLALPLIGGGIGGLDPLKVVDFMKKNLTSVDTTLVLLPEMYKQINK